MDVFWQENRPERARSSLTTAIWRLRHLLEPAGTPPGTRLITTSTGEVGFNWECNHWLDTATFEEQSYSLLRKPLTTCDSDDAVQMERLLALYRGELLEGHYESWALCEREHFRTLQLNCLMRLMEFHANHGNFDQSILYGQAILRQEPLREEIHRNLMRCYLANGQRALAVRQYVQCRDLLAQELALPPLEETEALYQQIVTASPIVVRAVNPASHSTPASTPPTVEATPMPTEVEQLVRELHLVKQRLDETVKAFEQLAQNVSRLLNLH
jgi:DNA-binding SARP family transcriptional activator